MSNDALSTLNEVFQELFDDEELVIVPETTAADVAGWDSLMHVRLILAVEKAFNLRFKSSEIDSLKNVGSLLTLIEAKQQ